MDRPLTVYIDFKSPYAYLAVEPTRRMAKQLDIPINWHMFYGGDWPMPEIARGVAHVIGRDNNVGVADTKRAKSWGMSAHGVLHTPDSQEVLFNGGFHCVAAKDPGNSKCQGRVDLQE